MAFAKQIEHADALTEIVVRLGRPTGCGVKTAAQTEEFTPRPAHRPRLNPR